MEQLPQQVINGLWQGGALALFALGVGLGELVEDREDLLRPRRLLRDYLEVDSILVEMFPVVGPSEEVGQHLGVTLGVYAWHGDHRIAQITALRQRMRW